MDLNIPQTFVSTLSEKQIDELYQKHSVNIAMGGLVLFELKYVDDVLEIVDHKYLTGKEIETILPLEACVNLELKKEPSMGVIFKHKDVHHFCVIEKV